MSKTKKNPTRGSDGLPEDRLHACGFLQSLGAEIPLVAAPMAGGPGTPQLVVAAADAGGLGFLAGGYKTAEQLAGEISEVRRLTSRFGVNLFVPNAVPVDRTAFLAYAKLLGELAAKYAINLSSTGPTEDDDDWDAKIAMLVSDPVPVVSFTFGLPTPDIVDRLQAAGSLVVQTVTSDAEAAQADSLGVNGLIVQGFEAGGHSGTLSPGAPSGTSRWCSYSPGCTRRRSCPSGLRAESARRARSVTCWQPGPKPPSSAQYSCGQRKAAHRRPTSQHWQTLPGQRRF